MQIQKPTDLDLHCLQRQGISGFIYIWVYLGSAGQGLKLAGDIVVNIVSIDFVFWFTLPSSCYCWSSKTLIVLTDIGAYLIALVHIWPNQYKMILLPIGHSEPIVTGLLIGAKKCREARGSYFV